MTSMSSASKDTIRYTVSCDRQAIIALLEETQFFRPDEMDIACEVLDDALAKGPAGHYQSFTIDADGAPAGWVCFGPTPCTVGTFDIYWLAVSPRFQGRGLGKALMDYAEKLIARRQGRLAVVETAGRIEYLPTRAFYERIGYIESARLKDFYAPGDDKVVYLKAL